MRIMPNINQSWSYDEAFAALETVIAQLENGDLPLEQALAFYEEGIALANFCTRKLADAELRVRQWQGTDAGIGNGGNGNEDNGEVAGDQTKPFAGWQDK
jgi:exodeoxyribonuclease VII small subunit